MSAILEGAPLTQRGMASRWRSTRRQRVRKEVVGKVLTYGALILYSLYSLLPIYWIATLAFKVDTEIYTSHA